MAETYEVKLTSNMGDVLGDMKSMLESITGRTGGGAPKVPGQGGGDAPTKGQMDALAGHAEDAVDEQRKVPGLMKTMFKKMGIQVGVASILKQSQIFTGTVGSIFQIFGALVDVILAPFLPVILPIVRLLGNQIPLIHSVTTKIADWVTNNLNVKSIDDTIDNAGETVIRKLFGWLPDTWENKMVDAFKAVNWGYVAASLGSAILFKKLGGMRFLGSILTKIPGVKWLGTKLGGLAAGLASKLIPGFGKIFGKSVDAQGKATQKAVEKGTKLKTAAEIRAEKAGGGGGFGGFFKKAAGKFNPKNLASSAISAAKTAGPMGIIKGTLKKALPMVGAGFALYEGIKGGIDVFKANRAAGGGFLSSLGKASAVAGTGAIGAAVSMVPGAGLLGPIAATAATAGVKAAMMATIDEKPAVNLNLNVNDTGTINAKIQESGEMAVRSEPDGPQTSQSVTPEGGVFQ